MTLLEILLVLALLVVIASLAVPALSGPLENERLRKSGDLLRAEWAKARVRAMRSGRIQVFQYTIGDIHYSLAPWATADDQLEASGNSFADAAGVASAPAAVANPDSATIYGELPEKILFFSGQAAGEMRGAEIEMMLQASSGDPTVAADPILFYPDGSSSSAEVVLANERQKFILVSLRGLTGIAKVSELMNQDQLGQ